MKTWMEFINQPHCKPYYAGRVLISEETYKEIQREAIKNHCHSCYGENGTFTHIVDGATECPICGAEE